MLLVKWLVYTIAILITAYLLPGVILDSVVAAVVAALIIGIINTFFRPLVLILTLPLNILTLGLLTFVINALLIMLASAVVPGFAVVNFWWALLFSFVVAIINSVLGIILTDATRES